MVRRVVNPFWQGRYVGASAGQNMKLNRSFELVARNWRSWARRFGTGAIRAGAAAGIAAQGLAPLGRIVKRVYKRSKVRPSSDFKQIAGVGMPGVLGKRRRSWLNRPRRYRARARVTKVRDFTSYKQLATVKTKRGRKIPYASRNDKIVKALTTPLRFRFGTVQDINAATGTFWLSPEYITATSTDWALPVYAVPLFNCNQGNTADYTPTAGFGMYELCWSSNVGNIGLYWRAVQGTHPTLGGPSLALKAVQPSDLASSILGRKGVLDWTRIKLCFWGKKTLPTNVRVRIVRPLLEEFAPEYTLNKSAGATGLLSTYSQPANEYWLEQIKYLLNGHMGGYGKIDRKPRFKTLQQWNININPIDAAAETATSDPRGHMKHLDIFNRWGRVIDYTEKVIADPSWADIINVNRVPAASPGYTAYPTHLERQMYLIIESVETNGFTGTPANANPRPTPAAGAANRDACTSFDISFESNFSKVEQL